MPFGLLIALKAAHLFLSNRFTQACARSDNMDYHSVLDIIFCDPESWFCFILSSIRIVSFAETSGRFCGCQTRWFWFAACVWHTLIGITGKSTLSHSGWCWILKWRCPLLAIGKTWKVVPWDSPPEPPPPTSKPRRCDLYTQTYFSLIEVFFFLSGQDPLSCSHAASNIWFT